MGRLDGKTALITGAAIGQGRAHAVRLSSEGANVILFDIAAPVDAASHPAATPEDLEQTADLARANGHGVVSVIGDVRDAAALMDAVARGAAEFGSVDLAVANAAVTPAPTSVATLSEEMFREIVDINTFGVWNTVRAVAGPLLERGERGSIVTIGSGTAYKGYAALMPYAVSKHAVVGLVKSMAKELGPAGIRVNAVHPGIVDTGMTHNPGSYGVIMGDLPVEERTRERMDERISQLMPLRVPGVTSEDMAAMVAFLLSDEAKHITGGEFKVDGGMGIP